MNNKGVFSNKKKLNSSTKNFIIAFGVFILVLGVGSVLLFMYSLDFDINNLVETTTQQEETTSEQISEVYSVDSLSGKSNIMFVFLNDTSDVEFISCSMVDFDSKNFKISQIDGDTQINFGDSYKSVRGIYTDDGEIGLKDLIFDRYGISVDKYVIFKKSDLKTFLLSFGGITLNIPQNINYHSAEFSIELSKGEQTLSAEKATNYLFACQEGVREQALCDITASLLKAEYIEKSERLFKEFANSAKTDISVIDFSNSIETIETYCLADDAFKPVPYSNGE